MALSNLNPKYLHMFIACGINERLAICFLYLSLVWQKKGQKIKPPFSYLRTLHREPVLCQSRLVTACGVNIPYGSSIKSQLLHC